MIDIRCSKNEENKWKQKQRIIGFKTKGFFKFLTVLTNTNSLIVITIWWRFRSIETASRKSFLAVSLHRILNIEWMTSNFHNTWAVSWGSQVFNGVLLLFFFPEGEILLKEFDDRFGISEGLLINVINLLEGIRESGFTEFTGLFVLVHNFVVEDGEVKSESKSDWVAGIKGFGTALGKFIVLKGTVFDGIKLISLGALGDVSVVITDHFVEESFGLISGGNTHAWFLDDIDDRDALVVKLLLDFLLVGTETIIEFWVFWVLLDGADGSNGGSLGSNLVLETNR